MPAATVITILSGKLSLGLDAATMTAYDCQTVSAALTANAKLNTLAATFCAGESQTAAASGFDLVLTVLQDWSDPDGICWFAYDNDGQQAFFELALDDPDVAGDVTMNGSVYVTALNFGGDAGTPLDATNTWPCVAKPVKGPAAGGAGTAATARAERVDQSA